jgi:ubiquinone/menaquinone biosynthesis C-methylase UbiE
VDPDFLHDLHQRYMHQANWTAQNRRRLFELARLGDAKKVLEVGSGTGAITHEIPVGSTAKSFGIDLDPQVVSIAHEFDLNSQYAVADGMHLPFQRDCFDISFSHFLLMWVEDPLVFLEEMRRVTRSGGAVIALAEPDYGGRIDYPQELERLGQLQAKSLADQGADVHTGRKLRMYFSKAGLANVQVGVLGGEWTSYPDQVVLKSEWETLKRDLAKTISSEELNRYQRINRESWSSGYRLLYVPTFFAIGWDPS